MIAKTPILHEAFSANSPSRHSHHRQPAYDALWFRPGKRSRGKGKHPPVAYTPFQRYFERRIANVSCYQAMRFSPHVPSALQNVVEAQPSRIEAEEDSQKFCSTQMGLVRQKMEWNSYQGCIGVGVSWKHPFPWPGSSPAGHHFRQTKESESALSVRGNEQSRVGFITICAWGKNENSLISYFT